MLSTDSTLIDVAFAVCTALHHVDERALLVGGSAATFYAPAAYQSSDCDFILTFGARGKGVSKALATLGFVRRPEGFYRHPDIVTTVEFPVGPAAIGDDRVERWNTVRRDDEILFVYEVTDVVRDRFMHFWAWGDFSALRAALDVAASCPRDIDVDFISEWIGREQRAAPAAYDAVRAKLFLAELRTAVKQDV